MSKLVESGGAASVRSGVDLVGILEERVASLAERHREALKEIDTLRSQLLERHSEVDTLALRLERRERVHEELRAQVEHLIERIGELELAGDANA